jgi:hypothetical protein
MSFAIIESGDSIDISITGLIVLIINSSILLWGSFQYQNPKIGSGTDKWQCINTVAASAPLEIGVSRRVNTPPA